MESLVEVLFYFYSCFQIGKRIESGKAQCERMTGTRIKIVQAFTDVACLSDFEELPLVFVSDKVDAGCRVHSFIVDKSAIECNKSFVTC